MDTLRTLRDIALSPLTPGSRSKMDMAFAICDDPEYLKECSALEKTREPDIKITMDDFINVGQLGKGGWGCVYLCKVKGGGNEVAVKTIQKNLLIRKKVTHLAMRERHALLRMNHPFIVKMFMAFQDDKNLYFVLEYVPNGTLREKFKVYGVFRNDVTRFYTAEIIMALEYLRKIKYVHRDLKMGNILLDKRLHIKLTDFGLAVLKEAEEDQAGDVGSKRAKAKASKQINTSMVGTPGYYAPEIVNKGKTTFSTDLWALGCILYESHTGNKAFSPRPEHIPYIMVGQYKPFPSKADPNLKDLVKKLLVVDPRGRLGWDDIDKLKNHDFYGTEDTEDWQYIHLLTPPTFWDPADGSGKDYDVLPTSLGNAYRLVPNAEPELVVRKPKSDAAISGASGTQQPKHKNTFVAPTKRPYVEPVAPGVDLKINLDDMTDALVPRKSEGSEEDSAPRKCNCIVM